MPDFLQMTPDDRREALDVAAGRSGRPPHLLEKDVWVVWALDVLFQAPFGKHLVLKGGTSLSKAFRGGNRFSRHWHDITRLDLAGLVDTAIQDPELGRAVARHKAVFFQEKSADGSVIDYAAAVSGQLQLIPSGDALRSLERTINR